jgi:queuine tRNA-ribosyltransferase
MHSVNRPSDEAHKLYVEQSHLASRLLKRDDADGELVIWDVGLGAASNAMAALHCFEKKHAESEEGALRPLRLLSFECDLDPLTLAAKHAGRFPHLRHGAPGQILAHGKWSHFSGLLQWELFKGDFLRHFAATPPPDLIFYDPFSAKTDTGLWTTEVFARIRHHCGTKSAELYTYSSATAVRVMLLAAGYYVAEGVGTGPKSSTTLAFTHSTGAKAHPGNPRLLGPEWLTRWRRSDAKYPNGLTEEGKAAFEKLIEGHPQF